MTKKEFDELCDKLQVKGIGTEEQLKLFKEQGFDLIKDISMHKDVIDHIVELSTAYIENMESTFNTWKKLFLILDFKISLSFKTDNPLGKIFYDLIGKEITDGHKEFMKVEIGAKRDVSGD